MPAILISLPAHPLTGDALLDRRLLRPIVTVLLALLVLAALPPARSHAATVAPATVLTVHAPILINGNAGFTPVNGVTGGNGTATNPYVIQGWSIAPLQAEGIELRNTTAHAVLQNLLIQGQDPAYVDVFLWNASNVIVDSVNATGSAAGVFLYQASNIVVQRSNGSSHDGGGIVVLQSTGVLVNGNFARYDSRGIQVQSSSNVAVTDNSVWSVFRGVEILQSTNVTVAGNRVANVSSTPATSAGVYVLASDGTAITGNTVTDVGDVGIYVNTSLGITMTGNVASANRIGAQMSWSSGLITHNSFLYNMVQSLDNTHELWNATYPTGGNWWSDYYGVDKCRGPLQNDCSAPDGIGDTPYFANSTFRDAYPLILPNRPPLVRIVGPAGVLAGRTTTYVADTLDPDGTVTSIAWDFGDGGMDSGPIVSHTYAASGTYPIKVRVTDNRSLSGSATLWLTVFPAVSFVLVSHPSGFRVPVPAAWTTHTDYGLNGQTVPVVSFGPTVDSFRTNLLVSYEDDPSAQETPYYLSGVVNATLDGVRTSYADAYLSGGLVFLSASGHAAVEFTIAYTAHGFLQRAAIVVSSAHGRDWLLILSTATSQYPPMNATFDAIVAGFAITALPPIVIVGIVGAVVAAVAVVVVLLVVRYRRKRPAKPRLVPVPPPVPSGVAAAGFCVWCGTPMAAGQRFCGRCGAPAGSEAGPPPSAPQPPKPGAP